MIAASSMEATAEDAVVQRIVSELRLSPHPEGGYYGRWYCSEHSIPTDSIPLFPPNTSRRVASSIHYLLQKRSALHRLRGDELWFFHSGSPIALVEIHPDRGVITTVLGDPLTGYSLSYCVRGGSYFGAFIPSDSSPSFALASCVVLPEFNFEDWDMPGRANLVELHADFMHSPTEIAALTRVLSYLVCDSDGSIPNLEEALEMRRVGGRE